MKQLLWLLVLITCVAQAQNVENPTNGIIILADDNNIDLVLKEYNRAFQTSEIEANQLSEGIWLLRSGDDKVLYAWCKVNRNIQSVSWNARVSNRVKPDDSRLSEQYYLDIIKAYDSWEVTTGGTDYSGNDIIIGVVDEGFDIAHEDLKNNIYNNPGEISSDNLDNDSNGFVDDINGWNQRTKRGIHDVKSHGTNVIGVLGAQGNNHLGIAGMNWNLKIVPVTAGSYVSDIIESYNYFLQVKKLFISSGGNKGIDLKVISYSGGLDEAFAKDYVAWCSMYDKLGAVGVLCVASTTNSDYDVEVKGDMPSTCTSPYLLVVNATNKADVKDPYTGYGNISVDIAAPGEKILSTDLASKGNYKTETGTSLSTPMVSGAAALLYSLKCAAFYEFVRDSGPEAALAIKDALIKGVDTKPSLTNKNTSGGRLNVLNSLNILLTAYCDQSLSPKGALSIKTVKYYDNILTLTYVTPDNSETLLKIYDSIGKEVFSKSFTPPFFGDKTLEVVLPKQLEGLYYFVSLINGKEISSKGFTAQDTSK